MTGKNFAGALATMSSRPSFHAQGAFMPDDKTKSRPQDRKRINLNEEYEVRYWTKKFGVSNEKLAEAVRDVGTSAQRVADTLGKKN